MLFWTVQRLTQPFSNRRRDEKRYRERKNRSERQRKKTEDNARLRVIVDSAMQSDPRLKKFKQEEKAAREAKRKGKPNAVAAQQALEEKKKKEEEAKLAAEAEAKKAQEDKVSWLLCPLSMHLQSPC